MVNFKPTPSILIDIITHICGKSANSRSVNADDHSVQAKKAEAKELNDLIGSLASNPVSASYYKDNMLPRFCALGNTLFTFAESYSGHGVKSGNCQEFIHFLWGYNEFDNNAETFWLKLNVSKATLENLYGRNYKNSELLLKEAKAMVGELFSFAESQHAFKKTKQEESSVPTLKQEECVVPTTVPREIAEKTLFKSTSVNSTSKEKKRSRGDNSNIVIDLDKDAEVKEGKKAKREEVKNLAKFVDDGIDAKFSAYFDNLNQSMNKERLEKEKEAKLSEIWQVFQNNNALIDQLGSRPVVDQKIYEDWGLEFALDLAGLRADQIKELCCHFKEAQKNHIIRAVEDLRKMGALMDSYDAEN